MYEKRRFCQHGRQITEEELRRFCLHGRQITQEKLAEALHLPERFCCFLRQIKEQKSIFEKGMSSIKETN